MKIKTGRVLRRLERELDQADDYQCWSELARQHDERSGMEKWKNTDNTSLYDYAEIRLRL